ncbi:MAG: MarR family transcriptional regulator [Nitrososphaerota archaeon]|jgi:DNA-binding MarR family transcriptional regulator|nr:MarR family transcriptional regulator [Nitrososphaerota archaeon]
MATDDESTRLLVWFSVREINQNIVSLMDRLLGKYGLDMSMFSIIRSIRLKGPTTMGELARATRMNRNTLKLLSDRMKATGLLAIRRSTEDRRAIMVELTKAGTDLFDRTRAEVLGEIDRVMGNFSEEEMKTILKYMVALRNMTELAVDAAAKRHGTNP